MMISMLQSFEITKLPILTIEGGAAIVFYFTVYSLIGWLIENSYNYAVNRKFLKENFLFGPFKPMYAFAPLILVSLYNTNMHWWILLVICFVIPTAVEYLTGTLLQKYFNKQWWDYSDTPFQLHGHICLPFSLCWMLLSVICLKWVHPGISTLYETVEPYWAWIWSAVGLYFLADLTLSIRRHSNSKIQAEVVPDTKLE